MVIALELSVGAHFGYAAGASGHRDEAAFRIFTQIIERFELAFGVEAEVDASCGEQKTRGPRGHDHCEQSEGGGDEAKAREGPLRRCGRARAAAGDDPGDQPEDDGEAFQCDLAAKEGNEDEVAEEEAEQAAEGVDREEKSHLAAFVLGVNAHGEQAGKDS